MKLPASILAAFALLASTAFSGPIIHSVFFKLKHDPGSQAETAFLVEARKLAAIPGVRNFEILKETSPKNPWSWGLTMKFADQTAYDAYNNHPDHQKFVREIWLKQVADFQEIDYEVETAK